ncbi:hypothetical protein GLAREA_07388 [Glarea lozoyensis ATCC 20868]|uniref:Uncharacterized protein n=1 Tax=Glarea lozoyensis (strain ATCC 20868 / MF5171) TaxID=1116229 RepID=S3D3A2_GLAL2|nr:uncharacterized protein GLAREA_07388 [Glarea lozoyensis ATCC 20868]EPE32255.1 hypothetical protein GLAREA_07388 [Glarea lozoyensis ATCC 20868]
MERNALQKRVRRNQLGEIAAWAPGWLRDRVMARSNERKGGGKCRIRTSGVERADGGNWKLNVARPASTAMSATASKTGNGQVILHQRTLSNIQIHVMLDFQVNRKK